jgi:hypothetical protein
MFAFGEMEEYRLPCSHLKVFADKAEPSLTRGGSNNEQVSLLKPRQLSSIFVLGLSQHGQHDVGARIRFLIGIVW